MRIDALIRILREMPPNSSVDIGKRSEYPHTFNVERVLQKGMVIVLESDDN